MTRLYEKRFLNVDGFHSIGAIGYRATVTKYGDVDAEIQISDCSRTVFIDLGDSFYGDDKDDTVAKERENNLQKINTMIAVLENCKRDYLIVCDESKTIKESKKEEKVEETLELKKKSIFDIFRRKDNDRT